MSDRTPSTAKSASPGEAEQRRALTARFVGSNVDYYDHQFQLVGSKSGFTWTFNWVAALLGPVWYGLRGIWNWSLAFVMLETFALVQMGRGLWGDLGAEARGRLTSVMAQIELRQAQLDAALKAGGENVEVFKRNIDSLSSILAGIRRDIQAAEDSRLWIITLGFALLLAAKLVQGALANTLLERRYFQWLSDRRVESGIPASRVALSLLFVFPIYIASIIHFTAPGLLPLLRRFPTDDRIRVTGIQWIEAFFNGLIRHGEDFFNAIAIGIRSLLDGLEKLLVHSPWLVIVIILLMLTGLSAGRRAALWTGAFLAYIGLVGLWEKAMTSLALLGTAACISIVIGIPLGLYCARRPRVYAVVRPIMDFMQTMPAFVYMIPVIALFGTGKVAAVFTTIVFGGTPVVRLTVLGLRGVPESIREAAIAYGASKWYLLSKVDLPLAAPSIRAGINQTILLSLAMVVVASLIGAKGLGEHVLEALQYASIGQGILAGFAILFLALILDRIILGQRTDR